MTQQIISLTWNWAYQRQTRPCDQLIMWPERCCIPAKESNKLKTFEQSVSRWLQRSTHPSLSWMASASNQNISFTFSLNLLMMRCELNWDTCPENQAKEGKLYLGISPTLPGKELWSQKFIDPQYILLFSITELTVIGLGTVKTAYRTDFVRHLV